ncbi:MAG: hypothetical protein LBQ88_07420 [Treponema sp.]|nr:hypothetical protein [Treponema sp.]
MMNFLLLGPRLGRRYDVLLGLRQPPPVAGELLLIDTGNGSSSLENTGGIKPDAAGISEQILEPETLSSVLLVLNEFKAVSLLVQVPVAGFSGGSSKSKEDLLFSVNEEFTLIERNIRNLFRAIRTGSVGPSESERYVGEVIDLSEQGKKRLAASLFNQDSEGMKQVEKTAAAFGQVWQSRDLLLGLIRSGGQASEQQNPAGQNPKAPAEGAGNFEGAYRIEGYSRVQADRDGKVRRIAPVLLERADYFSMFPYNSAGYAAQNFLPESRGIPHTVYCMIQNMYPGCVVEYTRNGYIIRMPNQTGGEDIIPLDIQGNLIFERPRPDADFRRLSLQTILEYEEEDRAFRIFLKDAEVQGLYRGIEPEKNPVFLYDYALSFREDMLADPVKANKDRWMDARNLYFKNLAEFFDSTADKRNGSLKTEEAARIFAALQEQYQAFVKTRQELEHTLASSLCILGYYGGLTSGGHNRQGQTFPVSSNLTDAYAAALLANSLITGRAVRPGGLLLIVLLPLFAALLINFCIRGSGIFRTFCIGIILTILTGAAFSLNFIINAYWIDPLIPLVSCAAGVLASCLSAAAYKRGFIQQFRNSYSPYVSASVLEPFIRTAKPLPGGTVSSRAVIAVVRNPRIAVLEGRGRPVDASREAVRFQTAVARDFKSAGAVIVGCEYGLVMAAFGSPLQAVNSAAGPEMEKMTEKAVSAIKKMAKLPQAASWCFSLDLGECAFTLSSLSGYTAAGQTVLRCRVLAGLAVRLKVKVLLSKTMRDRLGDAPVRRIELTGQKQGKPGLVVYELLLQKSGKK